MKNQKTAKLKLLIRVKIIKSDGTSLGVVTSKKMKIYSIFKHEKILKWKLEVVYLPGVSNSGDFNTREDALRAFGAWTEAALLSFVEEGEW